MNVKNNTKAVEGELQDATVEQVSVPATAVRARRLPEKAPSAFRTISEVADELNVQQHVLRFWETKFSQVKPLKRGGGRRYYRPEDVQLIRKIHHLLYTEGYTIKGVQKLLKEQGRKTLVAGDESSVEDAADQVVAAAQDVAQAAAPAKAARALTGQQKVMLESMLGELKELRAMLKDAE